MSKIILLIALAAASSFGQVTASTWAAQSQSNYNIRANVVYGTQSGYETKLDVYQRRGVTTPQPTLIFFHGGGWVLGTKESAVMSFLPWLEMGWNVVNVEYRLSHVALAPGRGRRLHVRSAFCGGPREGLQHRHDADHHQR